MNCSLCGRPVPGDEMIAFEGRWICGICKPVFVQQLREGVLPPVPAALPEGFDQRMLGFGELLAISGRMLRQDWLPIAALTVLVAVPVNLLLLAVEPGDEPSWRDFARYFQMVTLLETVVGVLAVAGIAKIVSERLEGRALGFGGALRHALRRWLPAVGTNLLGNLIIGLLLLALIVPGLIWMGYYSFVTGIVSLRGCAGKRALDDSKSLVRGRWWAVVGRILGLTGVALIPGVAIEIPLAFAPEEPALTFVSYVFTDLCYALVSVGAPVLLLNLEAVRRGPAAPAEPPPFP